ncbi:LytR/AlgR family response regulator transcription factor [Clostridioides difficile]|uniref:LytR/AlgR family response regulator transcription factor n=1 Tax=Clostridioides difficile TaxID=1496 RepID=UPI0021CA4D5E|nr:response regulator transcription factor [Clostridioides difficile]UUV16761.1 response regulator transcription factor [Clostridioides difficile]
MDILLFDNDVSFGTKLKNKINNILLKEGFDNDIVKIYRNAELLLRDINEKNKVRIFFIGINFKYNFDPNTCDGLWVAQQIREHDYVSPIIFLSNYVEIGISLFNYRLEAMDFILKNSMDAAEGKIKECIKIAHKRYLKEVDYQEKFFVIYKDFELWRIPFTEIIYFETGNAPHKVKIVTIEQEIEIYKNLKDIVDLDICLFRVHKSFVVNKEHIISLNLKEKWLKMSNGDKCPISEKSLQSVKRQLKIKKVLT